MYGFWTVSPPPSPTMGAGRAYTLADIAVRGCELNRRGCAHVRDRMTFCRARRILRDRGKADLPHSSQAILIVRFR